MNPTSQENEEIDALFSDNNNDSSKNETDSSIENQDQVEADEEFENIIQTFKGKQF